MPAGSAKTKSAEGGGASNTPLKTPEERLEAAFSHIAEPERKLLVEAFKDSPEGVLDELEKHGAGMQFVREKSKSGAHYFNKKVVIEPGYRQDRLPETVRHEVGHFIDHMNGPGGLIYSTQANAALSSALDKDRAAITGNGKSQAALRKVAQEAMKPNAEFAKHPAVSDIFDSVTNTRITGNYGHPKSYYKKNPERWKREVYANMFDIYASKDQKAKSFVRKFFPNVVDEFEKLYNK